MLRTCFIEAECALLKEDRKGGDDALYKMNLYFTLEYRNCVKVFSAPIGVKTCSG